MKSILDPTFKYVPSLQTDIRKTFERVRREQKLTPPAVVPVLRNGDVVTLNYKTRTKT